MSHSSRISTRSTRRNSQSNHLSCGSCCQSPVEHAGDSQENEGDRIILRSGRTISSAPSSQEAPEVKNEEVADGEGVQNMLQGLAFIQCEKESCLKWRKISHEEAELYKDETWYCCMNKNDPDHCRCDQPEEDQFVQLAESSGFQYTFSILPAGTLVWAKMTGHVPWPSIITTEPESQKSFHKEGTLEYYHVEFLGKRHYHQWLSPLYIDPYGDGRKPEFPQDTQSKKKGKKKGPQFTRHESLMRNKQYQKSFEAAATEAEEMKNMTTEKRLQKCVYSLTNSKKAKKPKTDTKPVLETKKAPKIEEKEELEAESPKNILEQEAEVANKVQDSPRSLRAQKRLQVPPEKPPDVPPAKTKKKSTSSEKSKNPHKQKQSSQRKQLKSKKDHQNLSQVLVQEERLFNGAWAHFMKSQGLVFDRKLSFDGSSLSAFKLFMSVQERGGYKEMSSSDWEAVSCELSKKSSTDSCQASLLKKLYKRNLLPYQKHLLPNKHNDPNNNNKVLPCSSNKDPARGTPKTDYPRESASPMPPPFARDTGNGTTAPPYSTPYSTGAPTVTQINRNFPGPAATSAGTSSGMPHNYYGGSNSISTNPGSYGLTWKPAGVTAAGHMTTGHMTTGHMTTGHMTTKLPISTNSQLNVQQAAPNLSGPNYQPMNNCPPLSSGMTSYGYSGGAMTSSAGLYGNPQRPVNTVGRGNMGAPASNGNGWQQKPSVQFNKDVIDIDNIIQALDRTEQFEHPASMPGQFAKPYTVPYENMNTKHQGRLPQTNYLDDVQRVPETVVATTYNNSRVSSPPSYLYSGGQPPPQLNDLVQETSRLDEVLQMEFSAL